MENKSGTLLLLPTSTGECDQTEDAKHARDGTDQLDRIREWVPAKIQTVLLPLGTLEPHGAAPDGTDILAPVAMARQIAPRKCDGFAGDPL
jgi:creatinine amidohydrolase